MINTNNNNNNNSAAAATPTEVTLKVNERCSICQQAINPDFSSVTRMPRCGHWYHARCAHLVMIRKVGRCQKCVESRPELGEALIKHELQLITGGFTDSLLRSGNKRLQTLKVTDVQPLDFGDDTDLHILLKKRLCIFRKVNQWTQSSTSNTTNSVNDKVSGNNNNNSSSTTDALLIPVPTAESFDQFIDSQERQQNETVRNNYAQLESGTGTAESLSSFLQQLTTYSPTMASEFQFSTPTLANLLTACTPSYIIVRKYNFDANTLLKERIKLETLFTFGYRFNDLLVFGVYWAALIQLGLTAAIWSRHRDRLPVTLMASFLAITGAQVIEDVCNDQLDLLASIQFTAVELRLLRFNAAALVIHGMTTVQHMSLFGLHISMREWHDILDLTGEMLVYSIDCITSDFFEGTGVLGWLSYDESDTAIALVNEFCTLFPKFLEAYKLNSGQELREHARKISSRVGVNNASTRM